ncbi:ISAs1 family transposase [Actinomyces oris]|uniref:ISAs1 family transposase n=1 Tax=Actinomyces oris TaxID=544580 RepID=A0AAW9KJ61_9ACTO|nr:ISAs1 family transposase [Actinomyces oris]MEA1305110.1 ISAs1 family transposase [Actinomyces oris]
MRHDLSTVLSLAVTGVLAGCRSLTAIWEHATDLTAADLEALGLAAGQALPSESTIRRVLQNLDPADVDAHLRSWLCTRTGTIEGRTVIAVDGKTMRGARTSKDPAPHLLAALDHATGAVLTQQRVAGKSNEIPALRELLEPLDLEGVVVSADAMHTQTGTARWITRRGGHYLLTVKGNQKILRKALKALPWKNVPSTSWIDTSHGRRVRRTVKAVEAPAWVDFPAAAQVVQLRRTRTIKSRKHVEVVYLICSLPMTDAQPEVVAAWIQGHWGIENRLHWVRDVIFDEDRHQLRTANGPEIMAALRNLAISLIRLFHSAGTSIASTTRSLSRQPKQAIKLLTQTPT